MRDILLDVLDMARMDVSIAKITSLLTQPQRLARLSDAVPMRRANVSPVSQDTL